MATSNKVQITNYPFEINQGIVLVVGDVDLSRTCMAFNMCMVKRSETKDYTKLRPVIQVNGNIQHDVIVSSYDSFPTSFPDQALVIIDNYPSLNHLMQNNPDFERILSHGCIENNILFFITLKDCTIPPAFLPFVDVVVCTFSSQLALLHEQWFSKHFQYMQAFQDLLTHVVMSSPDATTSLVWQKDKSLYFYRMRKEQIVFM